MQRSRTIVSALAAALASPAVASESLSQTPYGQARAAVECMESHLQSLDVTIEHRHRSGQGKALECLSQHRAAVASLLELSRIERAALVEAMADGEQEVVRKAHRNVMLWDIKAEVHVDAIGACPSQREYDVAKAIAEAEALGRD